MYPEQVRHLLVRKTHFAQCGVCLCADMLHQKMTETSATAHIGGVNIVLLEGITPNLQ